MPIDDFISNNSSLDAARFVNIGDTISGQIVDGRRLEDRTPDGTPKTWSNGDPMFVWVFDLDTTGNGQPDTALWVRGNMLTALRNALQEAGLKPSDKPRITVKHHAVGEPKSKGFAAPKLFKCKVEPGVKPANVDLDDF